MLVQKISRYLQTTGFADNSTVLPQLCLGRWHLGINHCISLTLKNLFSSFCLSHSIRTYTAQHPAGYQTQSLGDFGGRVSKGTAQTLSAMANSHLWNEKCKNKFRHLMPLNVGPTVISAIHQPDTWSDSSVNRDSSKTAQFTQDLWKHRILSILDLRDLARQKEEGSVTISYSKVICWRVQMTKGKKNPAK